MKSVYRSPAAERAVIASYDALLASWPVSVAERDIDTPWGATHVVSAGAETAPLLLLFHGVGDNSAVMWPLNIAGLSARFRCHAVDSLGGPGKSRPNERFYENFDYLAWMRACAAALGLPKFNAAGVSNGAVLAYEALVGGVPGLDKVVCIEGGPIVGSQWGAIFATLGALLPEILIPTRKNLIKALGKLSSPASRLAETQPEIVDHVILAMKSHNQGAMRYYRYRRYDPGSDKGLRTRMLFVLGDLRIDKSKYYNDFLLPGGYRTIVLKNAGHAANMERPDETNRLIIDFLS